MRVLLAGLAMLGGSIGAASAATMVCTAEAGFDWYTNPTIGLSQDYDPKAGPPVWEVDLATGTYTERFAKRETIRHAGTFDIFKAADAGAMKDFAGWDGANHTLMVVRVWVDGVPFSITDAYGDSHAGHCLEKP